MSCLTVGVKTKPVMGNLESEDTQKAGQPTVNIKSKVTEQTGVRTPQVSWCSEMTW